MKYSKILMEYVRDKNNRPIGVIVATSKNTFGWSLCSKKDRRFGTVINKKIGLDIAVGRAFAKIPFNQMPKSLWDPLEKMVMRAEKYFK